MEKIFDLSMSQRTGTMIAMIMVSLLFKEDIFAIYIKRKIDYFSYHSPGSILCVFKTPVTSRIKKLAKALPTVGSKFFIISINIGRNVSLS